MLSPFFVKPSTISVQSVMNNIYQKKKKLESHSMCQKACIFPVEATKRKIILVIPGDSRMSRGVKLKIQENRKQ